MRRKPSPRSKLTPPIGTRVSKRARGETRRDKVIASYNGSGWKLLAIYEQDLPYTTMYSLIFEYQGGSGL
ncbi:hypothetical protein ACWS7L_08190 [Exiguobacterium artemiae]